MSESARRDTLLIAAAKAVRGLGYGLLGVALGLHLPTLGLSPSQVGVIFTASLMGSALLTALLVGLADRLGRRRSLIISAGLMVASGILFGLTDRFELLVMIGLLGTVSPTAGEVGPFETLEQAILPQTVAPRSRNRVFGWYNSLAAVMTSIGALLVAAPGWLGRSVGGGFGWTFFFYAAMGAAVLACYLFLSPAVELPPAVSPAEVPRRRLSASSRRTIIGLSGLFGLDALAGGFVLQSMIAYWFNLRFGVGAEVLGPLFAAVELLKAASYLVAVWLADHIGLINTMVFSHLPSNLLLMAIPLMPTLPLAMTVLLLRHTLSQMDVPTRQSYVVAVVPPQDRTAASGITNLTRTITRMISPAIAGLALQSVGQGLPFFVGGGLKIVYDLALFASFRGIKPAEETADSQDTPQN